MLHHFCKYNLKCNASCISIMPLKRLVCHKTCLFPYLKRPIYCISTSYNENNFYTNINISTLNAFSPALRTSYTTVYVPRQHFHASLILREKNSKPSSQVEVTVHDLKEKSKLSSSSESDTKGTEVVPQKKSLGTKIKDEILHYYHGFKLLFIDVAISSKYVWRILNGEVLSRREHRQVRRNQLCF